jgi:hypothetical protein
MERKRQMRLRQAGFIPFLKGMLPAAAVPFGIHLGLTPDSVAARVLQGKRRQLPGEDGRQGAVGSEQGFAEVRSALDLTAINILHYRPELKKRPCESPGRCGQHDRSGTGESSVVFFCRDLDGQEG